LTGDLPWWVMAGMLVAILAFWACVFVLARHRGRQRTAVNRSGRRTIRNERGRRGPGGQGRA
jgi:hypothetical protein